MNFSRIALAGMAAASLVCAAAACSDDDTTPTPATTNNDAGSTTTPPGTSTTLYSRLGGKDGINTALGAIITDELANSEIASYFVVVGKTGHAPTPAAIQECFTNLLGKAAGGPASEVTYPMKTSGGFQCREMAAAHAGLGIPSGTFDTFVMIAGAKLKAAGVADADITTIAGVLNGTKTEIATDSARTSGPFQGDAGT